MGTPAGMKRDLDLCREILQRLEAHPERWQVDKPEIDGRSQESVAYHLDLLCEAGLVSSVHRPGGRYRYGLTWAGHEFLDAARNNTRWNAAKTVVMNTTGGLAFELLRAVLMQKSKELLGLE